MQDFSLWFKMGLEHILSLGAYDHILFLIALSCAYKVNELKQLILLITAFTIGHSLTLGLSAFHIFVLPVKFTELLIPVTILLTSVSNILNKKNTSGRGLSYWMALVFGLVHGMGFSYVLRAMLGKEESILLPLFSFNIGIEIAQIIIVVFILIIFLLSDALFKINIKRRIIFISVLTIFFSAIMIIDRIKDIIN
jgi:hypothetical protein